MTTQVATFQAANLPAALQQRLAQFNTGLILAGAAGGTAEVDRIGIKGSRFRIRQVGMDEVVLSQLHLDGVIVYANKNLNRAYFATKYDSNAEDQSPACSSTNGYGPNEGSKSPQSVQCQTCPQAVWGSKISEKTGKKLKACSDSQLMAFMPIDPSTNNFFMVDGKPKAFRLSVPAASLKNISIYAKTLAQMGCPLEIALTRITFDEVADGQVLKFAFNAALPEAAAMYILDFIDQNKPSLDTMVGADLKAMQNVQVAQVHPTVQVAQVQTQAAPVVTQAVQPQVMAQPVAAAVQAQPSATPNFNLGIQTQPVAQPVVQQQQPAMQPSPVIGNAPAALLSALQGVMG